MFSIFIWFSAAIFFYLVRIYGNEELPAFARVLDFGWSRFITEMIVIGIAVGLPFTLVDYLYEYSWTKKKPYWMIIGLQTIIQVFIGLLSLLALALFIKALFIELSGHEIIQNPMLFVRSKTGML